MNKENKRENFLRIANKRLDKINEMIKSLENLSNKSFYETNEKELIKLFDEIIKQAQESKKWTITAYQKGKPQRFNL